MQDMTEKNNWYYGCQTFIILTFIIGWIKDNGNFFGLGTPKMTRHTFLTILANVTKFKPPGTYNDEKLCVFVCVW